MHSPIKTALLEGLAQVFVDGKYSDKVLEGIFKSNRKFGSRDRRVLAETFYGVVRHFRRLAKAENLRDVGQDYQLEDFERLLSKYESSEGALKISRGRMNSAEWFSVSDEFYATMVAELGEAKAEQYFESMNVQAPVFLRANTLLKERDRLVSILREEDIPVVAVPESPVAIKLMQRKNVFGLESFKAGYYEVQDLGSQDIAAMLAPAPGERVVDACAGAGGKTLHLAALMKNKGRILALDIHEHKLAELKKRTRRAKVDIVETRLIDSSKVIKRMHETADRVLLDVPCTGSGVLRRNPDSKLRFSKGELERLKLIQAQILNDYSAMVKPGGTLVYSTCSVLPSENEHQVEKFLTAKGTMWTLEEQKNIAPTAELSDGFFLCRFRRQVVVPV